MTPYYFNQQVRIEKQLFKQGVNDVPFEIESHPHFLRYVECGYVRETVESDFAEDKKPKTHGGSAQQLVDRIRAKIAKSAEPVPNTFEEKSEPEAPAQKSGRARPKAEKTAKEA